PIPKKEYQKRFAADELLCLTPETERALQPRTVQELAARLADERLALARKQPEQLARRWQTLLGNIEPGKFKLTPRGEEKLDGFAAERIELEVEPGIVVPTLFIKSTSKEKGRMPVVVMVAQQGKAELLKSRAGEIAALLHAGASVCLPDLRGTGETMPRGEMRGPPAGTFKATAQHSPSTMLASGELMLGETILGQRIRDLRTLLAYLRTRPDVAGKDIFLWGDSLAETNEAGAELHIPWDAEKLPYQAEPLGPLTALLTALHEKEVAGVVARRGLIGYRALLDSQFLFVPVDVIVPGALTAGDLSDVTAALAPRPVRVSSVVDGRNRPVKQPELERAWQLARRAYGKERAARLSLAAESTSSEDLRWLLKTAGLMR
ncbi:MAG: hypothetical protein AB7K24_34005, partial [Gemmataceae bacterium]